MRRIFFSKGSKFDVDYRNPEKNPGNKLGFGDNIITIGFVKHLLLRRENTCQILVIPSQYVNKEYQDFIYS